MSIKRVGNQVAVIAPVAGRITPQRARSLALALLNIAEDIDNAPMPHDAAVREAVAHARRRDDRLDSPMDFAESQV